MDDIPPDVEELLERVLLLEERAYPNWSEIADICDAEIARLNETGIGDRVNGLPYHYLEDHDIRRRDEGYGTSQRRKVREWLERRKR